jgi:hypothetical protein
MGDSPRVILSNDLTVFFRQEVVAARSEVGVKMSDLTEYYLVNLLCDFSKRGGGTDPGSEPLAMMYKRATEADMAERVQLLKNLGDVALYVAGFFTDFIEKSLVDVDYYISMGGNAYGNLSGLVGSQRHGDTFAELYGQLSVKFTELVDVLNQISERSHTKSDTDADLLKLYDRWARTGSERIRKVLLERGLITTDGLPTEYIQ